MRDASMRSRGSRMKKLRIRKMPNGSANAVWASQIGMNPVSSPVGANSLSTGMNATWTGTSMNAITTMNIASLWGSEVQHRAYAASAQMARGSSVAGMVISRLLTNACPMPPCPVITSM